MYDDESAFAYWAFIEQYLPDYSSRDDVLHSDILTRYLDGEEGRRSSLVHYCDSSLVKLET